MRRAVTIAIIWLGIFLGATAAGARLLARGHVFPSNQVG